MTDQIQVIKQALEFCDYVWREIPMNDYAGERLEETTALLRQALEQPSPAQPLTEREIELIDGMIEMQLHHAKRCDNIANRGMAEKQKGWDMERVALLRKLKGGSDD